MKVDRNSWHGRVYQYWYDHPENVSRRGSRVDLCTYTRVVVVWAPLYWVFFAKPTRIDWMRPVYVLLPVWLLLGIALSYLRWPQETKDALVRIGEVIGLTALILLACGCIVLVVKVVRDRKNNRKGEASFAQVVRGYVKAKKQRVCPFIEFVDES